VIVDHALVIFPLSSDCADLDILCFSPPTPLIDPEIGHGVLMKLAMSWDMQAEHQLSMPMGRELVSK